MSAQPWLFDEARRLESHRSQCRRSEVSASQAVRSSWGVRLMVDREALAAIRERAEAATPGPWQWVDPETDRPMWVDPKATFRWSLRTTWTRETRSVGPLPHFVIATAEVEDDDEAADREFIAHAREDVPALLGLLDSAVELVAELADPEQDDLGDCPYLARWGNEPGHDDEAQCAYGCFEEPSCVTCQPTDGWPSQRARAFLAAIREGSQRG